MLPTIIHCSFKNAQNGESAKRRDVLFSTFHAKYLMLYFEFLKVFLSSFFKVVFDKHSQFGRHLPVLNRASIMPEIFDEAGTPGFILFTRNILTCGLIVQNLYLASFLNCFPQTLHVGMPVFNGHAKLRSIVNLWKNLMYSFILSMQIVPTVSYSFEKLSLSSLKIVFLRGYWLDCGDPVSIQKAPIAENRWRNRFGLQDEFKSSSQSFQLAFHVLHGKVLDLEFEVQNIFTRTFFRGLCFEDYRLDCGHLTFFLRGSTLICLERCRQAFPFFYVSYLVYGIFWFLLGDWKLLDLIQNWCFFLSGIID